MKISIADLYIGSNNTTGVLEMDKIRFAADEAFEGYTIIGPCEGRWMRVKEDSCIVRLIQDGASKYQFKDRVITLKDKLKEVLDQKSILVVWTEAEVDY